MTIFWKIVYWNLRLLTRLCWYKFLAYPNLPFTIYIYTCRLVSCQICKTSLFVPLSTTVNIISPNKIRTKFDLSLHGFSLASIIDLNLRGRFAKISLFAFLVLDLELFFLVGMLHCKIFFVLYLNNITRLKLLNWFRYSLSRWPLSVEQIVLCFWCIFQFKIEIFIKNVDCCIICLTARVRHNFTRVLACVNQ